MGSSTSTGGTENIQTKFLNEVIRNNQRNCTAANQPVTSDVTAVRNNIKISGDLTGLNLTNVETDATCLLTSSQPAVTTAVKNALAQQPDGAETSLFGFFSRQQVTDFAVDQTWTNNVAQLNAALCAAGSIPDTGSNFAYLTNTSAGGHVSAINLGESLPSANCSLNNYAKMATYQVAMARGQQGNPARGVFASFLGFFAIFAILVVLLVGTLFPSPSLQAVGYQKGGT